MLKPMTKLVVAMLLIALLTSPVQAAIRYVAIGDSYTIGTGAQPDEAWPVLITKYLRTNKIPIELVGNLGRNGWTSYQLIDQELPALKELQPDFVTILIGVNDWVQGVGANVFQRKFSQALDELLKIIPNPQRILVITIPDFSMTSVGKQYANGRNISQGILEFNQIIIQEAQKRKLQVFDLYPISQDFGKDPSLIASDGLHPSAKGYAMWADFIGPEAEGLLK